MRALLDTNILIHREAPVVVRQNIGRLFYWLDKTSYTKCIHPASVEEINIHADDRVRSSFAAKIKAYHLIQTEAALHPELKAISQRVDNDENSFRDTRILNEVVAGRVDLLITEDRGIHEKAEELGFSDSIFTIDGFLEKALAENPQLIDYAVLSVRKTYFGNINLQDSFFDSFRSDYPSFDAWFNRKSDEECYVSLSDGKVVAFLYVKVENLDEPYGDINPQFHPCRRLKIGTLKVELNGLRLGERFLKIVFDNAIRQRVDEIYVTIFNKTVEQERLIKLLEDYGFVFHGHKDNDFGKEQVFVRNLRTPIDMDNPRYTYPFVSRQARHFLVPIWPNYHTELLPDSILNNESPDDYVEHEPHRNAIRKVYISRSHFRELNSGDVIVFYRTGGYYKSVVTTLGIVEKVYLDIQSPAQFIRLCRQRSIFSDEALMEHWNYYPNLKPFIVEFLCSYSFPRRPNMAELIENGVIADVNSAPRGFEQINPHQFETIIRLSETDTSIIVD